MSASKLSECTVFFDGNIETRVNLAKVSEVTWLFERLENRRMFSTMPLNVVLWNGHHPVVPMPCLAMRSHGLRPDDCWRIGTTDDDLTKSNHVGDFTFMSAGRTFCRVPVILTDRLQLMVCVPWITTGVEAQYPDGGAE